MAFFYVCENVHSFLPPKCFLQDVFHSTNTLYVRLPYHTTADTINEFVLGRFMHACSTCCSWCISVVLSVSRWFSVIRYTSPIYIPHKQHRTQTSHPHTLHTLTTQVGMLGFTLHTVCRLCYHRKNIAYTYRLGGVAYTCMIYNVMPMVTWVIALCTAMPMVTYSSTKYDPTKHRA